MGKIQLDFEVLETYNPKKLMIYDDSQWEHISGKPSVIEITLPGYSEPIKNYFKKGYINSFNSSHLGINCPTQDCGDLEEVDLPDGIYIIKLVGSPDKFNKEKFYLRTTKLDLEVDKLLVNLDLDGVQDEQLKKKLTEIEFLIKSAKSNTRYSNFNRATELYSIAVEEVENFKNCC